MCQPRFLHHSASGGVRRGGDADYAFKAMLLKAEAQRRQGSFGGEAATPPCLVQLETDFDLVHIRPVFELIETNLADPATGRPVDSRPWAEPVYTPLAQAGFGEPRDSVGRQVSPAPDGGITKEALKFDAVFFAPGPQKQVLSLGKPSTLRRISSSQETKDAAASHAPSRSIPAHRGIVRVDGLEGTAVGGGSSQHLRKQTARIG